MDSCEIMKYYKDAEMAKKLLNQKVHPEIEISKNGTRKKHQILNINGEKYFVKPVSQKELVAEIYFAKLQQKAGLIVPNYFPLGKHGRYTHVASRNVFEENNCVGGREYYRANAKKALEGITGESRMQIAYDLFYMPQKIEDQHVKYSEFITNDGMKKFQTKRCMDIITKNTDAHFNNYFFVLDENNLVIDTVGIDFSAGGKNFYYKNAICCYFNEFGANRLTDCDFLFEMNKNENLRQFVSPKELSDAVGNIDCIETAKEVKEEFGLIVPDKLVDRIDRHADFFATSLEMID